MRSARLTAAAVSAVLLMVAACAEDDPSQSSAEQTAAQETAAPAGSESGAPLQASADVPGVELIDVATGDPVQLRSLLPAETPVLFWFWAPH